MKIPALAIALFLTPASPQAQCPGSGGFDLSSVLGGSDAQAFKRADQVREFHFPQDQGAHPDFRSEWWYLTGNLDNHSGERFGYQFTLFRFALQPTPSERASHWSTSQIYMAHFAVTDTNNKQFHFFERFARGANGLAGVTVSPFRAWLENWSLSSDTSHDGFPWQLNAAENEVALSLQITTSKPLVLQGDRGLSRKSEADGNASYYYSYTRMETRGTLTLGDTTHTVTGHSWMDREWSTSALAPDQVGWDWFALQLSNGNELMFYRVRRKDGSADPNSAGTLIDTEGSATRLALSDVNIEILDDWISSDGTTYPARWRITSPAHGLELEVSPLLADQETTGSIRYWEGAVDVSGSQNGTTLAGRGYVELVGYKNENAE